MYICRSYAEELAIYITLMEKFHDQRATLPAPSIPPPIPLDRLIATTAHARRADRRGASAHARPAARPVAHAPTRGSMIPRRMWKRKRGADTARCADQSSVGRFRPAGVCQSVSSSVRRLLWVESCGFAVPRGEYRRSRNSIPSCTRGPESLRPSASTTSSPRNSRTT